MRNLLDLSPIEIPLSPFHRHTAISFVTIGKALENGASSLIGIRQVVS